MMMRKLLPVLATLLSLIPLKAVRSDPATASNVLRLPPWMAGHENLMPKISPEQIHEIEDLREKFRQTDERKTLSEQPEMLEIARALVAKGDLIEKALVWLYVTAEPVERTPPDQFYIPAAFKRSRILDVMEYNSLTPTYLVPILRLRTDWIAGEVEANRFPNMFAPGEVELIICHLAVWGDASDRPRLDRLRNAFEKSTAPEARSYKQFYALDRKDLPPLPDDSTGSIPGRRRMSKPIYERIKVALPENQASASSASGGQDVGKAVSKKNSSKPVTDHRASPIAATDAPTAHGWIMWLAVVVAATAGAVWLLLRKSK